MIKKIFFILLLLFLISPVNAEEIIMEDSGGAIKYVSVNENYHIDSAIKNGVTSVLNIDRYSSEEDTFKVNNPGDTFAQFDIEMSIDADTANESIPVTLSNGIKEETLYINITNNRAFGTLLSNISVGLYTENGDFLAGTSGLCLFYQYFQFTINRIGYGMFNDQVDYGLMPVYENYSIGALMPCSEITIDISNSQNPILCRFHIYDEYEYKEEDDTGLVMGLYWVIESIIGDPDNVLYTYFIVANMYYKWVSWIILLIFTAPCMYVFFAGVCGLSVMCLNGSFRGGISAGFKTFVKIMSYPFTILKYLFTALYAFASGVIKSFLR